MNVYQSTRPDTVPLYKLRLFPISLERSAILAQLEAEERHALDCAQLAYDEERSRVEEEWRRGRARVRERLMEGIEERRRRAREEKEGEGTIGGMSHKCCLCPHCQTKASDAALDAHSRPPITRKLRNRLGISPPPTPHGALGSTFASGHISSLPITSGPFLNPHSLAVDELPCHFPLPLTSTTAPSGTSTMAGGNAAGNTTGRRRPKTGGGHQNQVIGGLGKSLTMLSGCKESDIESDLGEIRRGNKRRRAAAAVLTKTSL